MSRREVAAILVLLIIVLALAHLWPSPAASDVPVVSGVVPAGEFVPVKGGLNADRVHPGTATPGAIGRQACRLGADAGCSLSARPASRTPSPTLPTAASVSPSARPSVAPVRAEVPTASTTGTASWFASPIGVSAAGPALRAAIGPGWRGTVVTVAADGFSVRTQLGDWCACSRRAIDLDAPVFAALAPLSQGLVEVTISW
jgi:hypothetical protein